MKSWDLLNRLEKAAAVRKLLLELGPEFCSCAADVIAVGAKRGMIFKTHVVRDGRTKLGFKWIKPPVVVRRQQPLDKWRAYFGLRLKEARAHKRVSLDTLAAAIGVAKGTVHQIELGHFEPTLYTARMLAAVLGLPLEEMAGPLPPVPLAKPGPYRRATNRRKSR
jgi:DNA-binding XRE family transcriptional regulator